MKKITCLLFVVVCCLTSVVSIAQATLKDSGVTTYLHFGGGTPHLNLDGVKNFKQQRAFVDNTTCARAGNTDFSTERTPYGNYKYDLDLANRKLLGITTDWGTQGLLQGQNPGTYVDSKTGEVKQRSMRKTCVPFGMSGRDKATWKPLADYCKLVAQHYNGKGLLKRMRIQNEYDFKWNVWHTVSQREYAVCYWECYKAIRSVNQEIEIWTGGTIHPHPDTAEAFFVALAELCAAEGVPMPTDIVWDIHLYPRDGSLNQGSGTWGITPETADFYGLGMKFHHLVLKWKIKGWACGENGWATYTGTLANGTVNTDPSLYKQNAPVLQGYDIYHAQGLLMVRGALIWSTIPTFKGVTYWHCRDNYDSGPYYAGGVNYSNWAPKISNQIWGDYLNAYGNHTISNYRTNGTLYAVDLTSPFDTVTLVWTNQNKSGDYDAKPRPGYLPNTPPPTPQPNPTPNPQPATILLQYSTSPSHTAPKDVTNGMVIAPGLYYFFAEPRELVTPVNFQLLRNNVSAIAPRNENGYPYDLNGGPWYDFTAGEYVLTVKSGTQSKTVSFTVGVAPPPVTKEPVLETWIEGGKVFYRTAVKTYSIAIP